MAAKKTEVSFDTIRQAVRDALAKGNTSSQYTYVRELYPSSVVYEQSGPGSKDKLYRASYQFDSANLSATVGAPEEVKVVTSYETAQGVAFSLEDADFAEETDAEGLYCADCKLFDVGEYPDKQFSLTTSEADEAVAEFEAAPVFLEHDPENVITADDPFKLGKLKSIWRAGAEIFGTVGVTEGTRNLLKGKKPKLSVGWLRSPKRIREVSFVLNPRIKDAEVLTAFGEERKGDAMDKLIAFLKGKFPGKSEDELIAAMSVDEPDKDKPEVNPAVQTPPAEKPANDQSAQFAEMAKAVAGNAASQFADEAVSKGKATPAERPSLVDLFTSALSDDGGGTVKFTGGKPVEGERCANLRKLVESRPPVDLTKPKTHVFAQNADNGEDSDDVLEFSIDPMTGDTAKPQKKEAAA